MKSEERTCLIGEKYFSSPLYNEVINVEDENPLEKGDFPGAIVLNGTTFEKDPSDIFSCWLEKNSLPCASNRNNRIIIGENGAYCVFNNLETCLGKMDLEAHVGESVENTYHRIVRLRYMPLSKGIPREILCVFDELAYKELPNNHRLILENGLKDLFDLF
ncbi:MAG: hypothetical protein AABW79_00890 [Nanoarchaeota archaeon]